jgi:murein DD-endopeptidase MepM/ murein hydrolase activator NlpD
MNWLLLIKVATSFNKEIGIVLVTIGILLTLPIFAVVVVAESGLSIVSNALAALNPITHKVEVRDPNGNLTAELEATTVWPVCGYISEEFGVPHLPWQKHHTGIDIASPWGKIGEPVTPVMEGTVTVADSTGKSGYGKYVVVNHGNAITSLYGHLSAINVKIGDKVKSGDIIGLEGSTGNSTGPHVHLEIRVYGVPIEPRIFLVGEPQGCGQ